MSDYSEKCHQLNRELFAKFGMTKIFSSIDVNTGENIQNLIDQLDLTPESTLVATYRDFKTVSLSTKNIESFMYYAAKYPDYICESQYLQAFASEPNFETNSRREIENLVFLAMWLTINEDQR